MKKELVGDFKNGGCECHRKFLQEVLLNFDSGESATQNYAKYKI